MPTEFQERLHLCLDALLPDPQDGCGDALARNEHKALVDRLEGPRANGPRLWKLNVCPRHLHLRRLLPRFDGLAQREVGRQLLVRQDGARCRAGVVREQPSLDGVALVGLSVCCDDGLQHRQHRDGADELGWGLLHPVVIRGLPGNGGGG